MAAPQKLTVLLTGASGLVGSILRKQWSDGRFLLRCADIRPLDVGSTLGGLALEVAPLGSHETFVQLDTSELEQ